MGRIGLIIIGFLVLNAAGVCAQDTLPTLPEPTAFIVRLREPSPLNLDSLRMTVGMCETCWEIEGKVVFRILVDENGHYVKHIVLKTPHQMMTNVFEPIIPHIRWTPGILPNGKAAAVWVTVPFQVCGRH
jgi:hypothetical protein